MKSQIQLSSDQAKMAIFVFAFLVIVIIYLSQRNWRKLVRSFPSSMKVPWNQKDNARIQINGGNYRAVVLPMENGLSISKYGLMSKIFLPGQALIPWTACSRLISKEQKTLGFSVTQFYCNVKTSEETLLIMLPSDIGKTILENEYLKAK